MPTQVDSDRQTDWLGLHGARVLVAGAGGIGSACAGAFLAAGANVLMVDRDQDRLAALAREPDFGGRGGHTAVADLTEDGAGSRVTDSAIEQLGGLDVVLHCVGINDRRPILEFTEAEWHRIIDVNLSTLFGLAQAAGRHMVTQGHGRIIALSSVSGLLAHEHHGPYAASKGGINQLVRVMAREWAKDGVTVNAVAPGYVETSLTEHHLAENGNRARLESQVPAGRLGTPAEIAGAVLFLSSQQAAFITGHVLYVDGGRTLV